jgi:hypothetical protein
MANKVTLKVFLTVWAAGLLLSPTGTLSAQSQDTVYGLRQAGWTLVDKTDHDEWQAGKAPYEELGSLIYVVTYTLQKDGITKICTLARNMMHDTYEQNCSVAK